MFGLGGREQETESVGVAMLFLLVSARIDDTHGVYLPASRAKEPDFVSLSTHIYYFLRAVNFFSFS